MTTTPTVPCQVSYDPPADWPVVSVWLPLMRRLQSVAKKGAMAVVTIKVITDECGRPQWYGKPKITLLEPKARSGELAQFLDVLEKSGMLDQFLDALGE